MKIGCIGQGFVGKNTADDFENRGYNVVRYALEPEYADNQKLIADCDVVFIAVPTPSTPNGFDYSIVEEVLSLVGEGKTAVIKSTVLPGTTAKFQTKYPEKQILFSPEFLCEATAAHDVANPILNIVGYNKDKIEHEKMAKSIIKILPKCEHNFLVSIESAELFKYAHNLNGYFRVILANLLHDVGEETGADWDEVSSIMDKDVMMSPYYNQPVHKGGRGAGGNCFVKDMAAFRSLYSELRTEDELGLAVLQALEKKNIKLLKDSKKSLDIIKGVYGE
jgi:UDPglucose 6-dehydrogenase